MRISIRYDYVIRALCARRYLTFKSQTCASTCRFDRRKRRDEIHLSARKLIGNKKTQRPAARAAFPAHRNKTDGVCLKRARDHRHCRAPRHAPWDLDYSRTREIGNSPLVNYSSSFTRRNFANYRPSIASAYAISMCVRVTSGETRSVFSGHNGRVAEITPRVRSMNAADFRRRGA